MQPCWPQHKLWFHARCFLLAVRVCVHPALLWNWSGSAKSAPINGSPCDLNLAAKTGGAKDFFEQNCGTKQVKTSGKPHVQCVSISFEITEDYFLQNLRIHSSNLPWSVYYGIMLINASDWLALFVEYSGPILSLDKSHLKKCHVMLIFVFWIDWKYFSLSCFDIV